MPEPKTDVLVVGAGPSGLTLAIELARRGVAVRVVDRHPRPRDGSRGCTIWQRTLEVFDLMGLPVAEFVAAGCSLSTRYYHFRGQAPLAHPIEQPDSPHPQPLVISQSSTEAALREHAERFGVSVEWDRRAVTAEQDDQHVRVLLRGSDGDHPMLARWLVLAQGSRASLREQLGFGWRTTEFEGTQLVQVDARLTGELPDEPDQSHLFFTEEGTLGCLPLSDGRHRLFAGIRAIGAAADGPDPTLDEMQAVVRRMSGLAGTVLSDPQFAWRVRLYNAIAREFRRGRTLLLGDSAHTVVPVSAQGMNTGIQDAFNLGWKLADAISSGREELVSTYHDERYPVAEALLRRTAASYWGGVGEQPNHADLLVGISRSTQARAQIAPGYRTGLLAEVAPAAESDGPRIGDRVDDAELHDGTGKPVRLFELLGSGWTVLEFLPPGQRAAEAAELRFRGVPVAVHSIRTATDAAGLASPDSALVDGSGLARARYGFPDDTGGAVLIRPDGHLAQRSASITDPALGNFFRALEQAR